MGVMKCELVCWSMRAPTGHVGLMPAGDGALGHAEERRQPRSCGCWRDGGGRRGRAPGLHGSEHMGVLGHVLSPTPSPRYWDILIPFSPPQGVTHPSSYRFLGPQRGGSGCRGRRQRPCPAGRIQIVRGLGGAPRRTSTPHHPARHGWPGPGLAQSSDQSRPSSPGSGPHAAAPHIDAHRSVGGKEDGSTARARDQLKPRCPLADTWQTLVHVHPGACEVHMCTCIHKHTHKHTHSAGITWAPPPPPPAQC